jgi:hypothetical protein
MAVSKPRKTNPRKPKPTQATSAADWKKASSQYPLVETPTGKWIRIKKPGMTRFLDGGFLPDTLASAVRREIDNASRKPGAKKTSEREIMRELTADMDPGAVMDMLASLDRIVVEVVVEPTFVWHRRPVREDPDDPTSPVKLDDKGREVLEDIPEADRHDDVVYTDEMDQSDKNFVFQVAVGGSTDLSRFRQEQVAVMDALSAGQSVEEAPERAPAPRP